MARVLYRRLYGFSHVAPAGIPLLVAAYTSGRGTIRCWSWDASTALSRDENGRLTRVCRHIYNWLPGAPGITCCMRWLALLVRTPCFDLPLAIRGMGAASAAAGRARGSLREAWAAASVYKRKRVLRTRIPPLRRSTFRHFSPDIYLLYADGLPLCITYVAADDMTRRHCNMRCVCTVCCRPFCWLRLEGGRALARARRRTSPILRREDSRVWRAGMLVRRGILPNLPSSMSTAIVCLCFVLPREIQWRIQAGSGLLLKPWRWASIALAGMARCKSLKYVSFSTGAHHLGGPGDSGGAFAAA